MIVVEKEYGVKEVKRETDSEGKEKYAVLTLSNALDPNLLSAKQIMVSKVEAAIRKN